MASEPHPQARFRRPEQQGQRLWIGQRQCPGVFGRPKASPTDAIQAGVGDHRASKTNQ